MDRKRDIYLHAGDYCFAGGARKMHTLLGSCVSITMWHPQRKIGGMCHYALPDQQPRRKPGLNPRFGADCMTLFRQSAARHDTSLKEYVIKVFGGGNMGMRVSRDLDVDERLPVGDKNVMQAFEMLMAAGLDIEVAHVGEFGYRRLVFDLPTGDVWVRFTPLNNLGDQSSLTGHS